MLLSPLSSLPQLAHRLRSGAAAAPRELVVVPLLDEAALGGCGEAAARLQGVARLVLRELTEPIAEEAASDAVAVAAAGAAGEAAPAGAAGQDVEERGAEALPSIVQPRVLRPGWQVGVIVLLALLVSQ